MIAVEQIGLRQGEFRLDGLSFTIPEGRYGVLMGRTGCGKTSVLEAIAGLRPLAAGRIHLNGVDVTDASPGQRGIGYVPQDAALFPTMTVAEHLAFALRLRRASSETITARTTELADWLGIRPLLQRYPRGLSGGEAQRVALGRALSFRPRCLLMDEPLSSLDEATRGQLIDLLRSLRNHDPVTVLHVTHSSSEAQQLADVRFQLEDGRIREAT